MSDTPPPVASKDLPAERRIYAYRGPAGAFWYSPVVFAEGEEEGRSLVPITNVVPDRIPRRETGRTQYKASLLLVAREKVAEGRADSGSVAFIVGAGVVDLASMSTSPNNEAAAALVANPDFDAAAASPPATVPVVLIPLVEDLVARASAAPPETAPTDPAPPAPPTEEITPPEEAAPPAPPEDFVISAFGTADHIDRMVAGLEHTMRTQARADYSNTVSELRELAKGIRAGQVGALVRAAASVD